MKRTLLMVALAGAASATVIVGPASADDLRANASATAIERADGANAKSASPFVNVQYERDRRRGDRGGPDAVLFSNPEFRGERWVIDGDYMPDLANTGFNDRAQSLRVRRGYWIFCSDAQFQGRCRTFGPGDYPRLGWALDNKVSSGRRISNQYPYGGQPNWSDRR